MKPLFSDQPYAWTRTPRLDQTRAEYASPVERVSRRTESFAGVLLACALGVLGAVALVAWWSA